MRRVAFTIGLLLAIGMPASDGFGQMAGPGRRSVSLLGGTFGGSFDEETNTPLVATRYRIGVAGSTAAEFELGLGRTRDGGCLVYYSNDTFGDCDGEASTLITAGLMQGVHVRAGRLRPYAHVGLGTAILTGNGLAGFLLAGGGLGFNVADRVSVRAEVGRRFNGDGGTTHFMAGLELDVGGR